MKFTAKYGVFKRGPNNYTIDVVTVWNKRYRMGGYSFDTYEEAEDYLNRLIIE